MNLRPRIPLKKQGEIWQIIYIDLMTQVMILFVILWVLSQKNQVGVDNKVGDTTVRMVSLPGDVLFSSGESALSRAGQGVFSKLFEVEPEAVLNFDTGGLVRRLLVVHGHTDGDGEKDSNIQLGFKRAFAVYKEIQKYSRDLADHVVICSHADNSPAEEVPRFEGNLTAAQRSVLQDAKSKNRRITIEDKVVNAVEAPKAE